jgi:histidinol dehydrogenase
VAAKRIEAYHRRQLPKDEFFTDETARRSAGAGRRSTASGLYVPGGTASYPSSVLMNAVPARVAGVARIAMVTPASGGKINPLTLAPRRARGRDEDLSRGRRAGDCGAGLWHGDDCAVDKIVGPGNAYVAAAKREVFGKVGIDSVAGPSEILVVSDAANNPDWIAADLLSQAEHDASSQSILITDDAEFADRSRPPSSARSRFAAQGDRGRSWRDFGAIIVVAKLDDAAALVDRIAPEHLELATADPKALLARVRHAGAIFLGRHTPEAMGDYIAGPITCCPPRARRGFLRAFRCSISSSARRFCPARRVRSPRSGPTRSCSRKPKGSTPMPAPSPRG